METATQVGMATIERSKPYQPIATPPGPRGTNPSQSILIRLWCEPESATTLRHSRIAFTTTSSQKLLVIKGARVLPTNIRYTRFSR